MKSIKTFLVFFSFFCTSFVYGQFNWAQIGVDGLTCSACSRSVEMSIRKLSFVDSVFMNLEHTEGKIIFKKGSKVEIEKIAKAVTDAGFSLRSLYAGINIDNINVSNDYCWMYENCAYHFIKIGELKKLNGMVTLKFIGKKYMPKKEYKSWENYCDKPCEASSNIVVPATKTYYVSLL